MSRRAERQSLLSALIALLVAGTAVVVRQTYLRAAAITAYFSSATGLYPGDEVRIAGVRVGTISSITPQPDQAAVTLDVDHDVRVPADAKAVIVAQNLVAARYVQLAPLYKPGEPRMVSGASHPAGAHRRPDRVGRGQDAIVQAGNGTRPGQHDCRAVRRAGSSKAPPTRWTATATSSDRRSPSCPSWPASWPTAAATSSRPSTTFRPSSPRCATAATSSCVFQDRLATFSTVLDDSRTDLDAAMSRTRGGGRRGAALRRRHPRQDRRTGTAAGQRHPGAGRPSPGPREHPARRADGIRQLLQHPQPEPARRHRAPSSSTTSPIRCQFICAAIGAVDNVTAPETAKLCAQYLGPALRLLNFNSLPPPPINPYPGADRHARQDHLLRPGTRARRCRRCRPDHPSSRPRSRPTPGCTATCHRLPGSPATAAPAHSHRAAAARRSTAPPRRPACRHRPKGRHHRDHARTPTYRRRRAVRRVDRSPPAASAASTRCRCQVRSQAVRAIPSYHVEIANVGTLDSNSPVMIDDVIVGSVGKIGVENWHADVDVRVKPDVVIPANAVATIGQTSLLGSHAPGPGPAGGRTADTADSHRDRRSP